MGNYHRFVAIFVRLLDFKFYYWYTYISFCNHRGWRFARVNRAWDVPLRGELRFSARLQKELSWARETLGVATTVFSGDCPTDSTMSQHQVRLPLDPRCMSAISTQTWGIRFCLTVRLWFTVSLSARPARGDLTALLESLGDLTAEVQQCTALLARLTWSTVAEMAMFPVTDMVMLKRQAVPLGRALFSGDFPRTKVVRRLSTTRGISLEAMTYDDRA